jgi:DNA polymerase
MITREDILRELELMPLWTLRNPLPTLLELPVSDLPAELVHTPVAESLALPTTDVPVWQYLRSEDDDYLFALTESVGADEALLLSNIFMAMGIKVTASPIKSLGEARDFYPKLVVALGESCAQYLLQSNQSLADLRGIVHASAGMPLVATYDLTHLLQHWQDKAKAWEDLCLAKQTLQNMN